MASYDEALYGCITTDGYASNQEATKRYLGTKTYRYKPTVNLTIFSKTAAQIAGLSSFYYTTLKGGIDAFTIPLHIYGVTKTYNVKIVNDFNISYVNSSIANTQLVLEIQDEIIT
jgi:hypothetical protein